MDLDPTKETSMQMIDPSKMTVEQLKIFGISVGEGLARNSNIVFNDLEKRISRSFGKETQIERLVRLWGEAIGRSIALNLHTPELQRAWGEIQKQEDKEKSNEH